MYKNDKKKIIIIVVAILISLYVVALSNHIFAEEAARAESVDSQNNTNKPISNLQFNWEKINGVLDDGSIYDIAYGNGMFVAVGSTYNEGGVILTSKDGSKWNKVVKNWGSRIDKVKYGEGGFIAKGFTPSSSFVCTSEDGLIWQKYDFNYHSYGIFTCGTGNLILGEFDAFTIKNGTAGKFCDAHSYYEYFVRGVSDAVFGGNKYVAVGRGGYNVGKIIASSDGMVEPHYDIVGEFDFHACDSTKSSLK